MHECMLYNEKNFGKSMICKRVKLSEVFLFNVHIQINDKWMCLNFFMDETPL